MRFISTAISCIACLSLATGFVLPVVAPGSKSAAVAQTARQPTELFARKKEAKTEGKNGQPIVPHKRPKVCSPCCGSCCLLLANFENRLKHAQCHIEELAFSTKLPYAA
jgi:hypothetical protein